jgi:hypothetical protein
MTDEEIHRLLDELSFTDVEAVAEQEEAIRKHLRRCTICADRRQRVLDGELAALPAAKRHLILKGAERIASYFFAQRDTSSN